MNVKPSNLPAFLRTLTLVYHGLGAQLEAPDEDDPSRAAFEDMLNKRERARNGAKELVGFLKTYGFHNQALAGIGDTMGKAVAEDVINEMKQHPLFQLIEQVTGVTLDEILDAPIDDNADGFPPIRPIPGREEYAIERGELPDNFFEHLAKGDKIKAIKDYRAKHDVCLKTAKDRIETIAWAYRGDAIHGDNPPVFGPSRGWRT